MKLSWNMLFQALGSGIQLANLISGAIPPKYQPAVALLTALAQTAVAWKAHQTNPDGTPASTAYVKKAN
jgi:hypothetical protein